MPEAEQRLESASVSLSSHLDESVQPQPVPASAPAHQGGPQSAGASPDALRDDPQRPTSVSEDEVHTIFAGTNEADRYTSGLCAKLSVAKSFTKQAAALESVM